MKRSALTQNKLSVAIVFAVVLMFLAGCASSEVLPEGSYELVGTGIVNDHHATEVPDLSGYIRQRPATKLFSLVKRPGSKIVKYDSLMADMTCRDLKMALSNQGFLHADVKLENKIKDNKVKSLYHLLPGEAFIIGTTSYDIHDDSIKSLLETHPTLLRSLHPGSSFSVMKLNDLRKQITSYLNNNGYYHFNKEYIDFEVDTLATSKVVDVKMTLHRYETSSSAVQRDHPLYRIRNVNFIDGDGGFPNLRMSTLMHNTVLRSGELYSGQNLQQTYNNFSQLQAVRYTNIKFEENVDSCLLDCDIQVNTNKPSSILFQPEGTNTAGDLGAALSLTYENRNLFHGSEVLSIQTRGAFEAITGLEGYTDEDYQEYSLETKLLFPNFITPFLSIEKGQGIKASSEVSASYDLQNRPEFHRRVFSSAWRYRWTNSKRISYRFDVLDMNYVYMPWISETFKQDYLESDDNRNAILRYNYEDLFIMKMGFGISTGSRNYSLRTNVESSGNVLSAIAHYTKFKQNEQGQCTLFNIAFAQYVKGDIDYTRLIHFDENNQLAIHGALGIAYPYGNSNILPFEKRYFSGGANSLRGWSVRSIGPGRFKGSDGRIDFINQTGDIKLDLSVEYRTKLFWKINGAAFVDAGNIWTFREYEEQKGGQFLWNEFYKQLAVSYGFGMRLNLGFFILRLDLGVKAVNPVYETAKEHFPIFHPDLGRDLAFHFAVGMPF